MNPAQNGQTAAPAGGPHVSGPPGRVNFESLQEKVTEIKENVSQLKTDVTVIKEDVSQTRSQIKTDVSQLKTGLSEIKSLLVAIYMSVTPYTCHVVRRSLSTSAVVHCHAVRRQRFRITQCPRSFAGSKLFWRSPR